VKFRILLAVACFGATSTTADATQVVLTASGKITRIAALKDYSPTAVPPGSLAVGDAYTLTAVFDLDNANVTSTFDADPSINIYSLGPSTVSLSIGSYETIFNPKYNDDSTIQIWNNQGNGPVDSQSFSFFNFDVSSSKIPFSIGSGLLTQSVDLNTFDFTATARQNDLITDLKPLSAFNTKTFSMGLLNYDTNLFVHVEGSVAQAELVNSAINSSVPEPSIWMTMILGFGIVGAGLRSGPRARRMTLIYRPS
jgi:hypothetical protein